MNQGSAEKTRGELKENGRNAKQVVLKQHANKGLYAIGQIQTETGFWSLLGNRPKKTEGKWNGQETEQKTAREGEETEESKPTPSHPPPH